MPNLFDRDYEAEKFFYNQRFLIYNNFNEIRISDLSSAFTNSSIQYDYINYNMFTDNKNVIKNDMDIKDKIITVFH